MNFFPLLIMNYAHGAPTKKARGAGNYYWPTNMPY